MMCKNTPDIIKSFLIENSIFLDISQIIKKYPIDSSSPIPLPEDIVLRIIADGYDLNKDLVKKISDELVKKYDIYTGRVQKEQLKKYIDYGFIEDLDIFIALINQDIPDDFDLKKVIEEIISQNFSIPDILEFNKNLNAAIAENNFSRVEDYILFLYSRLVNLNERKFLSINDLFEINKSDLAKELNSKDFDNFKHFCNDNTKFKNSESVSKYNLKYLQILDNNGGNFQKNGLVYLYINQELFDKFKNESDFFSYLFNCISKSYECLQNHKTLAVHIKDIFSGQCNIKWKIYSYLSLYAEKFKTSVENRPYYKPTQICKDVLLQKFGITLDNSEIDFLNTYYSKNLSEDYLRQNNKFQNNDIINVISYFKKINHGFSFIDCFVLKTDGSMENTTEINFIKNETEILLIFNKHEIDDRKMPCPICGSLKISGNSYPEIGIRSWECKNPLCFERSKTNRGKRYSKRTILMQTATFDFSQENQISKKIIAVWRKDVVEDWNIQSLYEMLIKYYAFPDDSIIAVNCENPALFEEITNPEHRNFKKFQFEEFLEINANTKKGYEDFFNSDFFRLFLYDKQPQSKKVLDISKNDSPSVIIGDSFEVLNSIGESKIQNMVTSPPYYNAREYSQWSNLFGYLNDMYNINLMSNKAMSTGGVFFYNIGDIFDNEKIVVKSKMGEKRIPLGAYTIYLFEKAGFQLLDDIIWYKGEPQSNRHKNDGNYTPYYQKPANCYEHMFIFKKHGEIILNSSKDTELKCSNLIKFTPVFKIGAGGVNRYGHSAPFPKIVPLLSINWFSNKNDFVLDPFSGSGTTPIVANINNRRGIGIEMNEEYAILSKEKAKEEGLKIDLINYKENV